MNRPVCYRIVTGASLSLILSGCFGGAAPVRSEGQVQAERTLNRGIRAEQKGDIPGSEAFLLQSLATSSSIEDYPAQTAALINLARLKRLQHDLPAAGAYGDRALAAAAHAPLFHAEAAYEKALIELSAGRLDTALLLAQKSTAASRGSTQFGSRLNLAARIQLERGALGEAATLAEAALDANRAAGQMEEEANSLRILGVVARHEKRYEAGLQRLEEALQIDKRIGQSAKIALDLEELSATAGRAGRIKESAGFLERACEVHRAAGRSEKLQAAQMALADIYAALNEPLKAGQARDAARKPVPSAGVQPPGSSSTTTSPSSRP